METPKLTFYALKLTLGEVDELLQGNAHAKNFLLSFEFDAKDDAGFGAAIYVQNNDLSIAKFNVKLGRLDGSEYVIKGPLFLSTNVVPVKSIQSLLSNNPDMYLTMRPFIDKNHFIRYDIDTPNDDDFSVDSPVAAEPGVAPHVMPLATVAAAAKSKSVNSNPSPPL